MKGYWFFFFLTIVGITKVSGQDSVEFFSQEAFFQRLKNNHPVALQAAYLTEIGEQNLRIAKAGFDPKVYSDWDYKQFDKKNYFNIWKSGIKLPTWYGLEVKAGYDVASGQYLNNSETVPSQGLGYLGVSANLLQGLAIDERRAALQIARIQQDGNEVQRRLVVNDLLLEGGKVYWNWVQAYNQLRTFERAYRLAFDRFVNVKQAFEQGDKAAVDTLEAFIQVQNRSFEVNEARLDLQNSTLDLSNFLWENGQPSPMSKKVVAPDLTTLLGGRQPSFAFNPEHPDLMKLQFKLSELIVEKKLKKEKLKPKLEVNYNFLGQEFDLLQNGQDNGVVVLQNYKAGVSFSVSPFLRSERGNLELTEIKLEQTNLELSQKRLALQNKLNFYINEFLTLESQIELYRQVVANYQTLLDAETLKFEVGESSLFVVNARETKLIEAEIKLLSLLAKRQKALVAIGWANGQLGE